MRQKRLSAQSIYQIVTKQIFTEKPRSMSKIKPKDPKLTEYRPNTHKPLHYALSPVGIWKLRICQFHFLFLFGDELKTVSCSSQIAKESVAIQTGCRKDVNKFEGTSWPEPLKNWIQIFLMIQVVKIFGKYLYISNVKFTMNGCRHKFVIF